MIEVSLIDHMGSDLSVVNAARVSFDKQSNWEGLDHDYSKPKLSQADQKLIKYLASHGHWSPFAHAFASFRIKAPIFDARQLGKHQVGLAWNEVSRRYVDDEPEFFEPKWRKRAENVKQGSGDTFLETPIRIQKASEYVAWVANEEYKRLLEFGVCPEQARMVLPQSMMTAWVWSGSLMAFARVCNLRLDKHTQVETRVVAKGIADALEPLFPHSWKALCTSS